MGKWTGLKIEQGRLELVHEVDEVGRIEAAEGVAGDAEADGQIGVGSGWLERGGRVGGRGGPLALRVRGQEGGCGGERAGAQERCGE
jgi:hypothetical protein